jgi:acyl carrier protein
MLQNDTPSKSLLPGIDINRYFRATGIADHFQKHLRYMAPTALPALGIDNEAKAMQPVESRPSQLWSQAEIFNILKEVLPRVAPLKVTGPVFMETSLAQDLDFDSLDTIDMLVTLNEEFSVALDFEAWLAKESEREDTPFTIRSLCQCILETLQQDENTQ